MKYFLILTILFSIESTYSKESFLYIRPLKTNKLTSYQLNELQKIAFEYAVKTGLYKILLTPVELELTKKNKFNYVELNFIIEKNNATHNRVPLSLKFSLIDKKRNKNLKIVRKKNVIPRKFIAESKSLLKDLFFGKINKKKS